MSYRLTESVVLECRHAKEPPDRLHELVEAATAVFREQGYHRTQMADAADRLGVAKGERPTPP